jgi:type I restriction enzyme M protein
MSLTTLIKSIQDIMRKDVGVDGDAQRISQMVWLIFLKIFDDKEQEWHLTIPGYQSPLPSRFRWSNWAGNPEGMTGEELIDFVNNDLFPALKTLATAAGVPPHGKVVGSVFEDAYNYMKSGTLLRQVINTIEKDVDFNRSGDRHLFNDIYEKILSDLQSAGNAGEYYTPRAVTRFMVDMLAPRLGQTILDPACGTGGFLTCAIEHLTRQVKTAEDRKRVQESIFGVEKKPLPHMLATTNMMLHGIDVPTRIRHDNTLSRPLKDYGPRDRVDLIITNPPFGGMEEDGIENNFPRKYQTRETADLFMALIMHLLKQDTGRAAVVLPDGFLFGEGVKTTLKRELMEGFDLHTIVRLPRGVFSPYTSIATNILFFEKGGPTRDVWFFEHPYPKGYKSYSRSKPLTIAEFDLEKKWWGGPERKGRTTTDHAWKISATDLAARNYNLDCKNPYKVAVNHRDPEELMAEYQQIVQQLEAAQQALKSELMACLGGNACLKN